MRRRVCLLAALACAPPAVGTPVAGAAAPRALARVDERSAVALAGDQALFTRVRGRVLSAYVVPVGGGTARRVFSFTAPRRTTPRAQLAASPQRAAVVIAVDGRASLEGAQAFAGPLLGPWAPLGTFADGPRDAFPFAVQVDGENVFTSEFRGSLENLATVVRDPEAHDVAFASPVDAGSAVFAGDLVAYATVGPGDDEDTRIGGHRLMVREWRTGVARLQADLPQPIDRIALRADGRVVVAEPDGVYAITPTGSAHRIVPGANAPQFAGDRILVNREGQPRVLDPAGTLRRFGTTTESVAAPTADPQHVLWIANDCLLVADITAPAANVPGPGPCPRSEIDLVAGSAHPGATLPVRVRCVAAPSRCRGTVRMPGYSVAQRFDVPPGRTRTYRLTVTARGRRTLAAKLRKTPTTGVAIEARSDDGDRPPLRVLSLTVER